MLRDGGSGHGECFRQVDDGERALDQALDGTDLVEDPATGEQFEAPYSDYSQSGPDGPGYYVGSPGSETKLNVITPS